MQNDQTSVENYFKKFSSELSRWLPDGIWELDLALLQRLGLLKYHSTQREPNPLTRYFHLVETPEKITLINEQFVVWIVPDKQKNATYTLIALNQPDRPQLEIGFSAMGIYNSSRLVLRVLEKLLSEMQETEDMLESLKRSNE